MSWILALAALAGVVVGWIRGGRLDAIGRARFGGMPLLAAALVMAVLARTPMATPGAARLLQSLGYLAVLVVLWRNRTRPWTLPILAGLGLNAIVIALNGGHMPVSHEALVGAARGLDPRSAVLGLDPRHAIAGPGTRLGALGDVVMLGAGRIGAVLSAGDLLMAIGVAGFVQGEMGPRRQPAAM